MTAIRKVLIPKFGDVDVLQIVNSTCPDPPPNHVQIATIYAGFTGADVNMRKGQYPDQDPAPLTPGYALVGTVRAIGDGCTKIRPGDTVAVLTKYGAEAELVNQPEKHCIKVPDGLDLRQVTAVPCDWSTAYAMVTRTTDVQPGQKVFIHGMSGAVGSGLMILSRLRGAEVYGTASARNHDAIRAHGAHPFVYTDKAWMDEMKKLGGAHAVFDALGYESFDESFEILTPTGVLVAFGTNQDSLAGVDARDVSDAVTRHFARNDPNGRRTTFFALSRDDPTFVADVKEVFKMMQEGTIEVPIRKIWDMEDIHSAHRAWGRVDGIGSLLIKVDKQ